MFFVFVSASTSTTADASSSSSSAGNSGGGAEPESGAWTWPFPSLLTYETTIVHSTKLATFDYDGCLAKTSLFKKGPDAWEVLFPSIPEHLKTLHENGYKLVIFTNQSDIGKAAKPESRAKAIAEKKVSLSIETAKLRDLTLFF